MSIARVPEPVTHLIIENAPLWPLTSMRAGGPARWLAKPTTVTELEALLAWIQGAYLPHVVLGGGTNVLFSDKGYPGVVLCTRELKGIQIDGTSVTVSAGEMLAATARRLNRLGLSGMEWACGIPGTVGGAVVMNAGTQDGDMSDIVESVRLLTSSGVRKCSVEHLKLGYRTSALRTCEREGIVLEASLKLRLDDPTQCAKRERTLLDERLKTQPRGASSGCIFKNPDTGPSAGMLLDRAGCKALRVGATHVSALHANFIINDGQDNAADVLALIDRMRVQVLEHHGVTLRQEVQVITTS